MVRRIIGNTSWFICYRYQNKRQKHKHKQNVEENEYFRKIIRTKWSIGCDEMEPNKITLSRHDFLKIFVGQFIVHSKDMSIQISILSLILLSLWIHLFLFFFVTFLNISTACYFISFYLAFALWCFPFARVCYRFLVYYSGESVRRWLCNRLITMSIWILSSVLSGRQLHKCRMST